jgi:hypothetical protein
VAPDQYELRLHPADLAALEDVRAVLERELGDYVARTVAERDLACNRPPVVSIVARDGVQTGQIDAVGSFSTPAAPEPTVASWPPAPRRPRPTPTQPPQRERGADGSRRDHAAVQTSTGARLELVGPRGEVAHTYTLSGAAVLVGRRSGADVALLDGKVSREHARVEHRNGTWVVRDLGSLNGTSVNGAPVRDEQRLRDGDIVQIGHFSLRFRDHRRRR